MYLVERDVEILRFINEFGFCDIFQLMRNFNCKKTWMYELIQRLIKMGLVKRTTILNSRHNIFFLTTKGAKYTTLSPIDHFTVGQYYHHDQVISVYIQLRKQYPQATWISERRIKQEKFHDGLGVKGHISDGILMLPDGKQIAIEVEISVKAKHRIEKIIRSYCTQVAIKEVWYFCSSSVMPVLTRLASKMSFIKIYSLEGYIHVK